jgi:hypothetical protein
MQAAFASRKEMEKKIRRSCSRQPVRGGKSHNGTAVATGTIFVDTERVWVLLQPALFWL